LDLAILETIGIIGVTLSAIPVFVGFIFTIMPILTRPNKMGIYLMPISVIHFIFKSWNEVEYGAFLFLKVMLVMAPSLALIKYFGN